MSPNFIKQTTYHNSLTKPNLQVSGHPKAKLYKKSPTIAKRYNWPNNKNSQTFTDSVHLKKKKKKKNTSKAQLFSATHSYTTLWMTSKPHKYPGPRLVITQKETTIFIYRKIPTVSMTSQTRTGKINTTNLILINMQSYQRLRRLIHKYSSRHCAQPAQ